MAIPVDSTLEHLKYSDSAPTGNPGAGQVYGPLYRGADSVQYHRDENGNEFADQIRVVSFTADKTLGIGDRKTLQIYEGTGPAVLTIPTDAVANFTPGTTIQVEREPTSGAVTFAAPGVTLSAPQWVTAGDQLYPGEVVELTKTGANAWRLRELNDRQIGIHTYDFGPPTTWQVTGLDAVDHFLVTPAMEVSTISSGIETEHSGGVFAAELPGATGTASTVVERDDQNFIANAVAIRRPIAGATEKGFPLRVTDDGTNYLVFGLLQHANGVADGSVITASNLQISFVYQKEGALINTLVSGDIEFQLLRAVANDDYPMAF